MGLEVMDSGPSAATGQISPHCQSQFRDSTQHLNLCLPDNVGFVVTSDTGLQGTEVSLLHSDFFFFNYYYFTYVHSPYGGCSQVLSVLLGGYMQLPIHSSHP